MGLRATHRQLVISVTPGGLERSINRYLRAEAAYDKVKRVETDYSPYLDPQIENDIYVLTAEGLLSPEDLDPDICAYLDAEAHLAVWLAENSSASLENGKLFWAYRRKLHPEERIEQAIVTSNRNRANAILADLHNGIAPADSFYAKELLSHLVSEGFLATNNVLLAEHRYEFQTHNTPWE